MAELTASELNDAVHGVPEAARPEGLKYARFWHSGIMEVKDAHAVLMFEASMTRYLMNEGAVRMETDHCGVVIVYFGWNGLEYEAPTLIHALAAACRAIGEVK